MPFTTNGLCPVQKLTFKNLIHLSTELTRPLKTNPKVTQFTTKSRCTHTHTAQDDIWFKILITDLNSGFFKLKNKSVAKCVGKSLKAFKQGFF